MSGAILSVLLFSSSNGSILPLPIHTPDVLAYVEDEETAYLKFVSSRIKESNSNNVTTQQIPEAAKGPAIPPKVIWFRKYATICIGLQTVLIIPCF
jgi:hypothetical protein